MVLLGSTASPTAVLSSPGLFTSAFVPPAVFPAASLTSLFGGPPPLAAPPSASTKSDHKRFVHFRTCSEKSSLAPLWQRGGSNAPFSKGGRTQRGGIFVRDCTNVMWL